MKLKTITQKFQSSLAIIVIIALLVSSSFIFILNSRINMKNYENIITTTIDDIEKDIENTSDINMLDLTFIVKEKVEEKLPESHKPVTSKMNAYLRSVAADNGLSEVSIVSKDNIIIYSNRDEYVNFDMSSSETTEEFAALNNGTDFIVQPVRKNEFKTGDLERYFNKYAGVPLDEGGYIQIAISAQAFQRQIDKKFEYIALNRHIGQTGYVVISNVNDKIVSNVSGEKNVSLESIGLKIEEINTLGESFFAMIEGRKHLCVARMVEGYYVIGVVPMSEVHLFSNRATNSNIVTQALIFILMFLAIRFLIKENIVSKIRNINSGLNEITIGKLDTVISEYSTEEFSELSKDINLTVKALKEYSEREKEKIKKELEFARNIQMGALPKSSTFAPYNSSFDLEAFIKPAREVGGDFYDFYMLDENRLAVLIADVSGKGIPAAMFMMTCKTMIKNLIESGLSIEDAFTRANEELCDSNEAGMFVTVWMGIIDLKNRHIQYVNAGHNPPLITNENGEFEFVKSKPGVFLTGIEGYRYQMQEIDVYPNSKLFLYTDGVTEANNINNEMYGEDRLIKCLNDNRNEVLSTLQEHLKADMKDFVREAEQFDDITMVSVSVG